MRWLLPGSGVPVPLAAAPALAQLAALSEPDTVALGTVVVLLVAALAALAGDVAVLLLRSERLARRRQAGAVLYLTRRRPRP